eukprot:m.19286 g.19286  ORF g.19286 m.19286 type:complete len:914 (-) comp5913_c0_seq1:132-2873(-)
MASIKGSLFVGVTTTLLALMFTTPAHAVVWMPSHFGDGMVLQTNSRYGARAFINGFADPFENITISEYPAEGNGRPQQYFTQADANGSFVEMLNPRGMGSKSAQIVVTGKNNSVAAKNVQWGEVFLCSGQSNMVRPMNYIANFTSELEARKRFKNTFILQVKTTYSSTPLNNLSLDFGWTNVAADSPVSADRFGVFSAVCYTTVRNLIDQGVLKPTDPIGLIQTAYGGTPVQAWSPPEALATCKDPYNNQRPMNKPSVLYNAMIHPLRYTTIRSVLWFQGEANVMKSTTDMYHCTFGQMIQTWRNRFGIGDFPFVFVQLCAYDNDDEFQVPQPPLTTISTIRMAQAMTTPRKGYFLDTTGMAINIDLGIANHSVHSTVKDPLGARVARVVQHVAYGVQPPQVNYSGPVIASVTSATARADADAVRIEFDPKTVGASGLKLEGTNACTLCCQTNTMVRLCTFHAGTELCYNTTATLEGNVLHATATHALPDKPHSIAFMATNFPECAVYNSDGLPAGPAVVNITATSETVDETLTASAAGPAPVAQTPPMGFNSWNYYHCNIDEYSVRATADAIVAKGLHKVGFKYVNIDDCWQVQRFANGSIIPDPVRFPSGMKALADYVHSKGLLFGLYTAAHEFTCQKRPGSWEHEAVDAQSYCEWGIDYIKIDHCGGRRYKAANTSWINFREGITKCENQGGRPILMSVESCGTLSGCGEWVGSLANAWRTGGDIQANWGSVMTNLDRTEPLYPLAGPDGPYGGHWNDADMLQVGNVGLSNVESQSHFTMWALMNSPLLIGTSVIELAGDALEILSNGEITALNQDPLGQQGRRAAKNATGTECWVKKLADDAYGVVLLNRGDDTDHASCSWSALGLAPSASYNVRDLWAHKDLGEHKGAFASDVVSHSVVALKLTPLDT